MLEIKNVSKEYKTNHTILKAVNNVSLTIHDTEVVGFLGSNGAGKTTLVKMISNLISPTSGSITLNGEDVHKNDAIAQKHIGTMLEGARNVYNFLSIEDNITYFHLLNQLDKTEIEQRFRELLDIFSLNDKRHEIVSRLSRGMQQKVAIMVSVLKDPEILILDEPTLGLDISSQIKMRDFLKDLSRYRKKTLIICTHDVALAESVCDKIAVFHRGNLLHYDSAEKLKYRNRSNCYRCVVKKQEYITDLLGEQGIPYEDTGETIDFEMESLDQMMTKVKAEDVYLIEQQGTSLEAVLKELN